MTSLPDVPHPSTELVDGARRPSAEWWRWFSEFLTGARAIDTRVTTLEDAGLGQVRKVIEVLEPAAFTITAISRANPCVMTITGHTMIAGDFYYLGNAGGMQEVRWAWYHIASVNGDLVTVNTTTTRKGEVVTTGTALNSSAYTAYTSGATATPQTYRGTWTAPATLAWPEIYVTNRGSGSAGGGSIYDQFGGAGAGGATVKAAIPCAASASFDYVLDNGMPGIPENTTNNAYLYADITAFGTYTETLTQITTVNGDHLAADTSIILTSSSGIVADQLVGFVMDNGAVFETRIDSVPNGTDVNLYTGIPAGRYLPNGTSVYHLSPRHYTGECWTYGAGVGQPATTVNVGSDGGTPGVGGSTYLVDYVAGGKGAGSPPAVSTDGGLTYFNASFPRGGNGAMGGGQGGDIGQDGQTPGGGGAPGHNDTTVEAGFDCSASSCPRYPGNPTGGHAAGQSGKGAPAKIEIEYFIVEAA